MKKWIWQRDDYPNFTYDRTKLTTLVEKISQEQGYLIAVSELISKDTNS